MSEDEKTEGQPEFVAVTPRGAAPEPAQREAEAVREAAPETADEAESAQPSEANDSDSPAPESTEPEPEPAPAPPGPAPAAEAAAAPESAPDPAPPVDPAPPLDAAPPADPAPPLDAAPPLDPAPPTDPAPLTDPMPAPASDVEVSVRVAAEGMAAALAGEPTHEAEGRQASDRSVGPLAMVTAVCVVLTLAAATVLGIAARRNSHERQIASARSTTGTAATSALVAAKAETAAALTYDYRTLEADFQRAEAGMSRKFRANYAETAAKSVTPLAQKTHAVTTGTVAAAGVVSATPTTARILVFADQTVENKLLNATSRLDRSVIEVTMIKENGRWVIDNLQPF